MKYGRILFSREFVSPTACNIGDIAQTFAIDIIYQKMGIPQEDIVNIPLEQLGTYKGEKVLLPIDGYFRYSRENPAFPTSDDIIPVFLGVYSTSGQYLKEKAFWKKFEPIGCRDEASFHAMKKRGYDAYLTGCMTMLYPRREKMPEVPKVFVVDAYPTIEKYIPESLRPYLEYVTHDLPVKPEDDPKQVALACEKIAGDYYRRYYHEATLVITSRLHCASPCIAMGIPTIVVKDGYDERFGWLDKLIHLYTEDEFDQIDWNPEPVELEAHKANLFAFASSMIRQDPDKEAVQEIHNFYMNRDRKKLSASIFTLGYMWLAQYAPGLASFIREKILFRFTIAGSNKTEG